MLKIKEFIHNRIKPFLPAKKKSQGSISSIPADSKAPPIELTADDIIGINEDLEDPEDQEVTLIRQNITNSTLAQIPSSNANKPQKTIENLPPEELDKWKKQLIAKLIKKTDQNPQFKALILDSLSFIQELSLIQNSISPDAGEKLPPTLNEDQFLRLTPIELQFLINTPPELFNISLLSDIFKQKATYFKDNINGNPTTIIFYRNRLKVLGKGGLAEVSACLYAKLPGTEEEAETAQLKEGAIKIITRLHAKEAIKYATKSELDTLSEIRESGEYEGLIEPIFIGSNTLIDNEGNPATEEHFFITKIIHPLQGENVTYLSDDILAFHNAEKTIGFIREACEGLQKIHELGRVHWDLKPGNIFVGTSNNPKEPEQGKLGDLSCPKVSVDFLRKLFLSHFKHYDTYSGKIFEATIPLITNPFDSTKEDIRIPVTFSYINRASRHLKLFKKWAETGSPENIPPEILAIVDMGLMAELLDRTGKKYIKRHNFHLFPSEEIQRKTVAELTGLVKRLDYIPEAIQKTVEEINTIHEELHNPLLLEDQKQSLSNLLEQFQEKLQESSTKHLMTAEKLKTELERIENMIISNRK